MWIMWLEELTACAGGGAGEVMWIMWLEELTACAGGEGRRGGHVDHVVDTICITWNSTLFCFGTVLGGASRVCLNGRLPPSPPPPHTLTCTYTRGHNDLGTSQHTLHDLQPQTLHLLCEE